MGKQNVDISDMFTELNGGAGLNPRLKHKFVIPKAVNKAKNLVPENWESSPLHKSCNTNLNTKSNYSVRLDHKPNTEKNVYHKRSCLTTKSKAFKNESKVKTKVKANNKVNMVNKINAQRQKFLSNQLQTQQNYVSTIQNNIETAEIEFENLAAPAGANYLMIQPQQREQQNLLLCNQPLQQQQQFLILQPQTLFNLVTPASLNPNSFAFLPNNELLLTVATPIASAAQCLSLNTNNQCLDFSALANNLLPSIQQNINNANIAQQLNMLNAGMLLDGSGGVGSGGNFSINTLNMPAATLSCSMSNFEDAENKQQRNTYSRFDSSLSLSPDIDDREKMH